MKERCSRSLAPGANGSQVNSKDGGPEITSNPSEQSSDLVLTSNSRLLVNVRRVPSRTPAPPRRRWAGLALKLRLELAVDARDEQAEVAAL